MTNDIEEEFVPVDSADERLFTRADGASRKALYYLIGGIALICFAAFNFWIALRIRSNVLALQMTCNIPTLFAIGCFMAYFSIRRSPSKVRFVDDTLEIESRKGVQTIRLADLSMAAVSASSFITRRRLKLSNRQGKCVATIPEVIQPFDVLVELVQLRLLAYKDDQVDHVRRRKARRQAVYFAIAGILFPALLTFLIIEDVHDREGRRLLKEQGQPVTAKILRHFTAPDGTTCRIEFQVTDVSGATGDHNVEVMPGVWELLKGESTVAAVTVPGRPDIAHLAFGEIDDKSQDLGEGGKILLYVFGGLMSLLFWVVAILNWRGIDIDLDSKTGKFSIKRFGTGR